MSPSYDKDFTDMAQLYTHTGKPSIEAQLPEWINSATTQQTAYAKGKNATPIHILYKLLSLQILCENSESLLAFDEYQNLAFPLLEHSDMPHKQGLALMKQGQALLGFSSVFWSARFPRVCCK